MDMLLIRMGTYRKCVVTFCESHGTFITNLISLLWCYFSWLKLLPDLISNNLFLTYFSNIGMILSMGKQKLFICCFNITAIG